MRHRKYTVLFFKSQVACPSEGMTPTRIAFGMTLRLFYVDCPLLICEWVGRLQNSYLPAVDEASELDWNLLMLMV